MTEGGVTAIVARQVLDLVTKQGSPWLSCRPPRRALEVEGAEQAVDELDELFNSFPIWQSRPSAYTLDLALARGLDYYTGPVFEATVTSRMSARSAAPVATTIWSAPFWGDRSPPPACPSVGAHHRGRARVRLLALAGDGGASRCVVFPETVNAGARAGDTIARRWTSDRSLATTTTQPWRSIQDRLAEGYSDRRDSRYQRIGGRVAAVKDLAAGDQRGRGSVADFLRSNLISRPNADRMPVGQRIVR